MAQMLCKTSIKSSDYGDDFDFDEDTLMELDNNVKGSEERAFSTPQVPGCSTAAAYRPQPYGDNERTMTNFTTLTTISWTEPKLLLRWLRLGSRPK